MHNATVRILARALAAPAVAASIAGLASWPAARAAEPAPAAAPPAPRWEGAIGLMLLHHPTYLGSDEFRTRALPGIFLRHGRFSLTTASGFVTRSNDEVHRGVSADLVQRDDLRVSLSARLDGGRDPDDDDFLHGMNRVRPTVRARLAALKRYPGGWRLGAALSPDLLGRGGGVVAELNLGHEWLLGPALRASAGVGITAADSRYLRSYFGVSAVESARSGHAEFRPGAGLRDIGASVGLRAELGPRWVGYAGAGATRLLGPTLDSPLTRGRSGWSLNGGLAWRF